jgi:crotonobetainyl-CoA:carnitine CoA-transferase CaiB-like acyl-CoA transferase
MQAVIGILAAVIDRGSTGKGQFIDISLSEAAMNLAVPSLSNALESKISSQSFRPSKRNKGILDGGLARYRNYETKDNKYIAVGSLEDVFWNKLCSKLNMPEKTADQSSVEVLFKSKSMEEWINLLKDADVCVEPILEPHEIFDHSQHIARNVLIYPSDKSNEKDSQNSPQLVLGPRLSNYQPEYLPSAPILGEHTKEYLLSNGFSEQEIADLLANHSIYSS